MIRISDTNGNVLDVPSGNAVEIDSPDQSKFQTVFFGPSMVNGYWLNNGKLKASLLGSGRLYVETLSAAPTGEAEVAA